MAKEDSPEVVLASFREIALKTHGGLYNQTDQSRPPKPYNLQTNLLGRLPIIILKRIRKPPHLDLHFLRLGLRGLLPKPPLGIFLIGHLLQGLLENIESLEVRRRGFSFA